MSGTVTPLYPLKGRIKVDGMESAAVSEVFRSSIETGGGPADADSGFPGTERGRPWRRGRQRHQIDQGEMAGGHRGRRGRFYRNGRRRKESGSRHRVAASGSRVMAACAKL